MKAVTYHAFGGAELLRIEDAPEPRLNRDDMVLVAVHAASINVIDSRTRRGEMSPFVNKKFPKTPGVDFSAKVLKVGRDVVGFQPGDSVFGATNPFSPGAMAQRLLIHAGQIARMPHPLSFYEAASVPIVALAALAALRDLGSIAKDSSVLIYGSSGGAGLMSIELANFFGARVTAVCGTGGVDACLSRGAHRVIDYRVGPVRLDSKFDIIIDFSGRFPFTVARPHLTPNGRFIESTPTIPKFIGSNIANLFRRQKHLMLSAEAHTNDLEFLAKLITQQRLRHCLSQVFPASSVERAFQLQEKGGVVGKLVVDMLTL